MTNEWSINMAGSKMDALGKNPHQKIVKLFTHHSAQKHGLWRIKSCIFYHDYLVHYGLHIIHLWAKQNTLYALSEGK